MFDTTPQFALDHTETANAKLGSFVCYDEPEPIRCGNGKCTRSGCGCTYFKPKSMDEQTCLTCDHSYNDHE